jgi:heavy metal translocating P-type ATPase
MLFSAALVVAVGGSTLWGMRRWLNSDKPTNQTGENSVAHLRGQQLQEISSEQDSADNRRVQKKLNDNLAIASSSLAIAATSVIISPSLIILSLPGFFYVAKYLFIDAYKVYKERKVIGIDALSALVKILLLVKFQFLLCNVSAFIYAFNRKLMSMVKDNSTKEIVDVFRKHPRTVFVRQDEHELEIPFEAIKPNDIVVVCAGGTIPVDGEIVQGTASIDQHILNGESQPAEKSIGEEVYALTLVLSGRIEIQVEKAGEQTTAARIGHILTHTVDHKTSLQLWAESMTDKTVVPFIVLGAALSPVIGLINVSAFLYSHPKYKTTLTGSIGILTALNTVSHSGILVKDGRSFELLTQIDTVVFDKTGTLTVEQPTLNRIHVCDSGEEQEVLRLAAMAEYKQNHPIATAILEAATERDLNLPEIEEADYKVGYGLTVSWEQKLIRVGSLRFIKEQDIAIPATIQAAQEHCHENGYTLIVVAIDKQVFGALELHATVRPEAQEVVQGLRERGIKEMYIVSGDHQAPTQKLAEDLGIDYLAEVLPEQKADFIEQLQKQNKSVCYVGDGINDSIALKKAKVSVSLKGASTIAIDTAQIILMDQHLTRLCTLFDLSHAFQANAKRTFAVVFIPHAIGALTGLLQAGFVPAFILAQAGLLGGVGTALIPLSKDKKTLIPLSKDKNNNSHIKP